MTSEIVSTGHVKWTCACGNVVHTGFADISHDNKTTYTGGGASDSIRRTTRWSQF